MAMTIRCGSAEFEGVLIEIFSFGARTAAGVF